ncbi:MAG: Rv3654c family TadE-like protein [Nakamurella sp.]
MTDPPPGVSTSDDRGSATVIGAVMIMVLLVMTTLVIHLGAAVVARHRAAAAADLAALAGARAAVNGVAAPCRDAAEIAEAGAARLDRCEVRGWEIRVEVSTSAGILGQRAAARARAGPDLAAVG